MKVREFRVYVAPGFTVRNVVAAVLEQGWPEATRIYDGSMSVRKRKGWREVRFYIGAETISRSASTIGRGVRRFADSLRRLA
jgi:hypothetical protein